MSMDLITYKYISIEATELSTRMVIFTMHNYKVTDIAQLRDCWILNSTLGYSIYIYIDMKFKNVKVYFIVCIGDNYKVLIDESYRYLV